MSGRKAPRFTIIGGAGFMGHRIGAELCLCGCDVVLYDRDTEKLDSALLTIQAELEMLNRRGLIFPEDLKCIDTHMRTSTDLKSAVAEADIVLEVVPEDADLKARVFKDIEKYAPIDCVLATNTMQLSVSLIAHFLADPSRVIGLRFLHPVYLIDDIEITSAVQTDVGVVEKVKSMMMGLGKDPFFREPGQNVFHRIPQEHITAMQRDGARKRNERLGYTSPDKEEGEEASNDADGTADDGSECSVCMTNERCMVLDPCGHFCLCEDCAREIEMTTKQCPICRRSFIKAIKSYKS